MSKINRSPEWIKDEFHLACAKLDAAPDGVQVVDLDTWHDQNSNFDRKTSQMVKDILAGKGEKWEARARAQMKAAKRG